MLRTVESTPATWEFRQRMLILIVSQLLLAWCVYFAGDRERAWYSPEFSHSQAVLGALLTVVGACIRVLGTATLSSLIMSTSAPDSVRLCRDGMFAVSRNPLYLGSLMILAGYGTYFGWIPAAIFTLLHWLRYERVIRLEEIRLAEQWHSEFERYVQEVPRWSGGFSRWKNLTLPPITSDALISNGIFIGFAAGCVAASLTGQHAWLIPFQAVGGMISVVHLKSSGTRRQHGAAHRKTVGSAP